MTTPRNDIEKVLLAHFGDSAFRPGVFEAITKLLEVATTESKVNQMWTVYSEWYAYHNAGMRPSQSVEHMKLFQQLEQFIMKDTPDPVEGFKALLNGIINIQDGLKYYIGIQAIHRNYDRIKSTVYRNSARQSATSGLYG